MKLSAPYRLCRRERDGYAALAPYVAALLACRTDRLFWASDWPHTELFEAMPDDRDPALLLGLDRADADTRRRIFIGNPAALYGFDWKSGPGEDFAHEFLEARVVRIGDVYP